MNETKYPCPESGCAEVPVNQLMNICREESVLERLTARRQRVSQELSDLDAALSALNSHPDISDVLVKLSRVTDRLR